MAVSFLNPKFDAVVGTAVSIPFTLPTDFIQVDELIVLWTKIGAFPPGLNWDGTTITGTPLVAGTFEIPFWFTHSHAGQGVSNESSITAYIRDAEGNLPSEGLTYPGHKLKTITTNLKTYSFGTGVSGETLKELADAVNIFFAISGDPVTAYVVGDQFLLSFLNGDVLESVTLEDDSEVDFSTVIDPEGNTVVNNAFFGKDNPADEEYSWYTIIHTCAC